MLLNKKKFPNHNNIISSIIIYETVYFVEKYKIIYNIVLFFDYYAVDRVEIVNFGYHKFI